MQDQKTAACTLYPEVIPVMAYMGGVAIWGGGSARKAGYHFQAQAHKKG